ncbi:MAG: sugar phosphate nucleotidyltransferase [Syntrophobacteraceae bacterium]|jgi:mannose-1-phosphate guanylyltransferase
MKAVIQAGGKGTRLRPYTWVLPKPLMPVGDLPVIEMLLKWLCRNGIQNVYVTIGYLGHLIRSLCGDGSQWGMQIVYSEEPEPLGTIGPLLLIREHLHETFLVLNGDLITDLNLRQFIAFHRQQESLITIAATEKSIKVDLGVLDGDNGRVEIFREKPEMKFRVSMGIYCMEPGIMEFIPKGVPFGFDDLMYAMLERKLPVHVYPHDGFWMDIGREEDFQLAQETFRKDYIPMLGH